LYLAKLKVYNFRNLSDQSVELSNGPVYITGLNGNGKTNLVEALYLLSGSRSFRTNTQSELVKWGQKEASVFGIIETKGTEVELGIALSPGQRRAFKNGQQLNSVTELVGACSVVAFSPAELALVKGAPAGRRKFLDRHMVDLQPSFLNVLMSYQRALESKAALLKGPGVEPRQLEPWNKLLSESGGKIVDNRLKFIKILEEKARIFHSEFAQSDGPMGLTLESELAKTDFMGSSGEVDPKKIEQELNRIAQREIALRSCVLGPHRDDMAITVGSVDSRAFASQGQTRSLVLALKLGVIELLEERLEEPPIVILDDVDSELDAKRRDLLFKALAKKRRQIFITGTGEPPESLVFEGGSRAQRIEIVRGVVLQVKLDS
jgi:DNA replication and repair protein RecF